MRAKFTPGPWSVESDGFTLCMGSQCVATAIAPDGASVETQRANARLIAAAPDLLAASILLYADPHGTRAAKAAIAKATGAA